MSLVISKPDISLNNDIEYYLNDELSIIPSNDGSSIQNCILSPDILPDGLSFNKDDCSITGTAKKGKDKTLYTITAENFAGSSSTSFNLTIYNDTISALCSSQGKSLINITIYTGKEPNSIYSVINDLNNFEIISLKNNNNRWSDRSYYSYIYCLKPDSYIVKTIDMGDQGWNDGYIEIYFDETPLGIYAPYSKTTRTFNLNCIYIFIFIFILNSKTLLLHIYFI